MGVIMLFKLFGVPLHCRKMFNEKIRSGLDSHVLLNKDECCAYLKLVSTQNSKDVVDIRKTHGHFYRRHASFLSIGLEGRFEVIPSDCS